MHGALTMDELRDALGDIREFMGRHDAQLEGIKEHLARQNGRVGKLEEAHAGLRDGIAQATGAWKAVSAISALIGGGVAWAAKHFFLLLFVCGAVYAQFGAAKSVVNGTGAPNSAQCASINNVGRVYARKDGAAANTTFYVCANTGVSTYAWELLGAGGGGAVSSVTAGATGALIITPTTGAVVADIDTAYPFISVAPPYIAAGANRILPGGFIATLPPTSSWTARNFSTATFTTSGLNGAISILSTTTGNSLNIQGRAIGSTTTLIAAVSIAANAVGGNASRCGVGIQRPAGSLFEVGPIPLASGSTTGTNGYRWSNPTTPSGGFGSFNGYNYILPVTYIKIILTGGNVELYMSPFGTDWTLMATDTQTNVLGGASASTDEWIFYGGGNGTTTTKCTLLSWSAA